MWKNAFAYVTRQKFKSLLLALIIMVMATLSLLSLSLRSAVKAAGRNNFKNITNSFSLQINRYYNQGTARGAGNIKGEDISKIEQSEYVASSTKRINAVGDLVDNEIIDIDPVSGRALETKEHFEKALMVTGVGDSEKETKFVGKTYALTAGEHLKPTDKHQVLVHEELAKKNNWKIGDKFKLRSNIYDADNEKKAEETVEVTIKGFFSGKNKRAVTFAANYYANEIITDLTTAAAMYGYTPENALYQDATFFVRGEEDLDKVFSNLQKLSIDWRAYKLLKSADNFPALQASINGVNKISRNMGILSISLAMIILSLCLLIFLQARKREAAIKLALGMNKLQIVGQFFMELLLLATFALPAAYGVACSIGDNMQKFILQQVNRGIQRQLLQAAAAGNLGGGAESDSFNQTLQTLTLNIGAQDVVPVLIGSIVVIVISLLLASYFILHKSPKELLSDVL